MASRGLRNHNPGNIERGQPWQGLADPQDMTPAQRAETRFCVFRAPEWGIRAIARILITYQDRYDIRSVRGMIGRWAPAAENDTDAYVRTVTAHLGVAADTAVDVHTYAVARALVAAIIRHENGEQPYSDDVIDKGLALAGIEPPVLMVTPPEPPAKPAPRPLSKTSTGKTGAAGLAAAAGTALTLAADNADAVLEAATHPAVRALTDAAPWVGSVLALLAVVAIALLLARKHHLEHA